MMKAVVRFFRRRAIKSFLKHKKHCILPDISKYPTVAVLLDKNQYAQHKEIEQTMTRLFALKRYAFIVINDEKATNMPQNDNSVFIFKDDFNFWGLIKAEKHDMIKEMSYDMVVDFSKSSDELLTHSYVMTLINNTFRVTFGSTCPSLYDMVIDSKKDDNMLNRIQILHNYLLMLLGRR